MEKKRRSAELKKAAASVLQSESAQEDREVLELEAKLEARRALEEFEAEEAAKARAIEAETNPDFDGLRKAEAAAEASLQDARKTGNKDLIKAAGKKFKVHQFYPFLYQNQS